jgi:hypothetical protein
MRKLINYLFPPVLIDEIVLPTGVMCRHYKNKLTRIITIKVFKNDRPQ